MARQIQTVQPYYPGDDGAEAAKFWERVAADPNMVVTVEPVMVDDTPPPPVSVFSTYDRALSHAKALDGPGAVIVPKRLDEPDWGNTEVN